VLAVYPTPSTLGGAPNDVRTLVKSLSGRYVVVQLTDIAPVDSNVYFADDTALAVSTDGGDDLPITEVTSGEDGGALTCTRSSSSSPFEASSWLSRPGSP